MVTVESTYVVVIDPDTPGNIIVRATFDVLPVLDEMDGLELTHVETRSRAQFYTLRVVEWPSIRAMSRWYGALQTALHDAMVVETMLADFEFPTAPLDDGLNIQTKDT